MGLLDTRLAHRARRSPALRPPAIAAYRALDRLMPAPPGPRVMANSMQKSGTHLLMSMLDALPRMRYSGHMVAYLGPDAVGEREDFAYLTRRLARLRDSHYLAGHLARDAAVEQAIVDSKARLVTIVRDPRAHVVSWVHYLLTAQHITGRDWVHENFPDAASLTDVIIRGTGRPGIPPYLPEIGERFRRYTAWSTSPIGMMVRFEDLVGTRGGGDDEQQLKETRRILEYLGYLGPHVEPRVDVEELTRTIFSPASITFRSGQIDSWRDELAPDLADEVFERCGDLMETWGYAR